MEKPVKVRFVVSLKQAVVASKILEYLFMLHLFSASLDLKFVN